MHRRRRQMLSKVVGDLWGIGLTQLIPELPALVCHACSLLPPECEAGISHKLLSYKCQHPGSIGISHPKHLSNLPYKEGQVIGNCRAQKRRRWKMENRLRRWCTCVVYLRDRKKASQLCKQNSYMYQESLLYIMRCLFKHTRMAGITSYNIL